MSIIPTTFNDDFPPYTVIGGSERLGTAGLSAVLLNRGERSCRRNLFRELEKTGFDTVVSVETADTHYEIKDLSARFPFVRFVLLKEAQSPGSLINIAAAELDSPLFFVLWNDLSFMAGGTSQRIAERLRSDRLRDLQEGDESPSPGGGRFRRLCTVPVIQSRRFETVPTLMVPALRRGKIRTFPVRPAREGLRSLYPFDGVGIYDRERFIRMGGFDGTLKSSFWQLMDFGFRAWLWGEEIAVTRTVRLSYGASFPTEDGSEGADRRRFYLKNIAPVFRSDYAYLPMRRLPGFLFRSGESLLAACGDFSEGRRWVHVNRFRWRRDPRTISGLWEPGIISGDTAVTDNETDGNVNEDMITIDNILVDNSLGDNDNTGNEDPENGGAS